MQSALAAESQARQEQALRGHSSDSDSDNASDGTSCSSSESHAGEVLHASPGELHPRLAALAAASGGGRTSREQRVFKTVRSVVSRYGWKVRLQSLVVYVTHVSMFTSLLLLLRNADGGAAKVNVRAVAASSAPAAPGNVTLHLPFAEGSTRSGATRALRLDRDQLCQLEYRADPGPRSPLNAPNAVHPGLNNVTVWGIATAILWLNALAYGAYLARLVARDYRDVINFNERDMYGLSRVRRRFKISSVWVDYIVLEVLLMTLLMLAGSLYAYSLVYRVARNTETRFRGMYSECACRIDTAFLIDLTVSVALLNAKSFSVLLSIWDAERKNRLLFHTGNLKVVDYILTRVGDYDSRQTDRTRRLASIALDRVSGGKLANTLETNLNRKFKKEMVQGARGAAQGLLSGAASRTTDRLRHRLAPKHADLT
eukprot:g601.t1